jgi:hypothetical protein
VFHYQQQQFKQPATSNRTKLALLKETEKAYDFYSRNNSLPAASSIGNSLSTAGPVNPQGQLKRKNSKKKALLIGNPMLSLVPQNLAKSNLTSLRTP